MSRARRAVRAEEIDLLRCLAEHEEQQRDEFMKQVSDIHEVEDWDAIHALGNKGHLGRER